MENKNYFPPDFFLDNGQTINLHSLGHKIEDPKEPKELASPYLLNLKTEQKKANFQAPHLLNLKTEPEELFGESFAPTPLLLNNAKPLKNSHVEIFVRKKSGIAFLILCFLGSTLISGFSFYQKTSDLKGRVLVKANVAYANLNQAQSFLDQQDYDSASLAFAAASQNFQASMVETEKLGRVALQILALMPIKNKLTQGPRVLKIGEYLAASGEYLTNALKPFSDINAIYSGLEPLPNDNQRTLTQAILESRDNLAIALNNLERAEKEAVGLEGESVERDLAEQINLITNGIPVLRSSLNEFLDFNQDLLAILGEEKSKTYLLLFQNNNEIRATGGFIGSYGLLNLDKGQIKNLAIDGIYNPDGQLAEKISPPSPLRFTNTRWHSRDANWFPDFPASADKVAWFLEKTGAPSVDGVIALTPNVIVELLKITGPIEMPEYDTAVNADNFVMQTQKEVELEYDRELNRPKQFLADLAPKLLDKVLNSEKPQWFSLLSVFSRMLDEKHLLFYFFDPKLQEFVAKQNWDGRVKDAPQDYLQLVNTNINGGKTDNMVRETINLTVTIETDGAVVSEAEIIRKHTGDNTWPSINNIDYLRLYVPAGSELISASGFQKVNIPPLSYEEMQYIVDPLLEEIRKESRLDESSGTTITKEFGKTCFGNWVSVKPQETAAVKFKYRLPFKIKPGVINNLDKYTLLAQKQSGSFGSNLILKIIAPPDLKAIWRYPDDMQIFSDNTIGSHVVLDTDKYFGVALEKK